MFRCYSCDIEKDRTLDNFCRNKNNKDGLSHQCKVCAKKKRDINKENRKNYPSSSPEYRKNYAKANKEHINQLRRARYKNNPDKYKKQNNETYLKYRDERLAKFSRYYYNNKEEINLKHKQYREENKEAILLRNRKRRKNIQKYENISQEQVNNLLLEYDNKCFYCKISVKRGINLHLDHKVPVPKGGEHATINNLVPACKSCNLRKGTKTDEEYFEKLNKNGNK